MPLTPGLGRKPSRHTASDMTCGCTDLFLDFTGTLSTDGVITPGVAERLVGLSSMFRITVLTADTFGTAATQLAGLPVELRFVETGADKAEAVLKADPMKVIAIGNGRNDIPMIEAAGLGIAVVGREGAAAGLVTACDIVVNSILDALEILSNPLRLKATLRD